MSIRDEAMKRIAQLKATGGMPAKPMPPAKPKMSPSAKQIKTRQDYEAMPEGDVKRGPR